MSCKGWPSFMPPGTSRLTVIFASVIGLVAVAEGFSDGALVTLIIGGLALYSAAIALLAKIGFDSVYNLESIGLTDSLSGLPNRRALHPQIRKICESGEEISVALIDLDGFKIVNDLYGHAVGDEMIKQCAVILREVCGEEAQCYRLGGDEFAISMAGSLSKSKSNME